MTGSAVCATKLLFVRSRFTGKERDTESGNDYFGARYYASSMGRFMSPDWSAKAEPVPYAKLDNPQSPLCLRSKQSVKQSRFGRCASPKLHPGMTRTRFLSSESVWRRFPTAEAVVR